MGNSSSSAPSGGALSERERDALSTLQQRFAGNGTSTSLAAAAAKAQARRESNLAASAATLEQQQTGAKRPPPLAPVPSQLTRKQSKNNLGVKQPTTVGQQQQNQQQQVQLIKRSGSSKNLNQDAQSEAGRSRVLSCGEAHIHHTEAEVVTLLAQVITERVMQNDAKLAGKSAPSDIFCGPCAPKITVEDYLERLIHYLTGIARFERDTGHDSEVRSDMAIRYLVMAVIYLDKINNTPEAKARNFVVCSRNIHRLLIAGITVASKIVDDYQPKNTYFAQLGGISVQELNALEREFCLLLGFRLTVLVEEFDQYYANILSVSVSQSAQSFEPSRARQGSAAAA